MSPNEAQLRAFLHDGEGDVPDATSVISHGQRVRYERRRRINTILSSAAVIAVVATGLTFLFTTRGSGDQGGASGTVAGGSAHAPAPLGQATRAGATAAPPAEHGAPAAGTGAGGGNGGRDYHAETRPRASMVANVPCPLSPASYALPGGGGLKSYGAAEPMFAHKPAGMKLCAYSMVSYGKPKSVVLSAKATRTVTQVIENAPKLPGPSRMCPARPEDANRRVQIISVDAAGRRLRPVTITAGACGPAQATNGTSVRYLSRLPASLRALLAPQGSTPR